MHSLGKSPVFDSLQDALSLGEQHWVEKEMIPTQEYLTFNNEESAVDSLLRAEDHILRAEKCTESAQGNEARWNSLHWKWVIICLQNSLYTFALTVAAGTNPDIVKTKKGRVVDLMTALKRCIGVKRFIHSKPVEFTRSQMNSICWLHSHFRNKFEHFSPSLWSIELKGMPNICIGVLESIRMLALDSKNISYAGRYYWHHEKERKIEESVTRSVEVLRFSALYEPSDGIDEFPDLDKQWNMQSRLDPRRI